MTIEIFQNLLIYYPTLPTTITPIFWNCQYMILVGCLAKNHQILWRTTIEICIPIYDYYKNHEKHT